MEEWNDIYDAQRRRTGRRHLRGTAWGPGEYGLVVCVGVYDGRGKLLLTRRASEKSFAGTWENTGGAAQAGEDSLTAIQRELREETGIAAPADRFEFLGSECCGNTFYDFYCLKNPISLGKLNLQPGETDGAMWASYGKIHWMIRRKKICRSISRQFLRQERELRKRNMPKIRGGFLDGLKKE